jgi:hypothetical protein
MNFYQKIPIAFDQTKMNRQQKLNSASNPNTPIKTLQLLATDEDCDVRRYVAENPNTPLETLKLLATDKDSFVRYWVAKNPNTPLESLQILATDENSSVRYGVAQNPNRTELIERLVFMTDYTRYYPAPVDE